MSNSPEQANFKSRARVIDLLGREQIADAPTAVGELFKNALDAGARNAWIDFNESKRVLTIRDDGLGMRKKDVLEKWLVLATDSKHGSKKFDEEWGKFADKEQKRWLSQHKIFGEKGIGRLSVGVLGSSTLLWTVWGNGDERMGTLCYVHWSLFRHPGKLFEDLPIPYLSLERRVNLQDIQSLFDSFRQEVLRQTMLEDESWGEEIRLDVKKDIDGRIYESVRDLKELSWDTGTTFVILNTSDNVEDLFLTKKNVNKSDELSPEVLKAYSTFNAFWNPFQNSSKRPFCITPSKNGKVMNRGETFWQVEDFAASDHHISINVTKDGFASGVLRNYGEQEIRYERQLGKLPKLHHAPGNFCIEVGYVRGEPKDSRLSSDDHREFNIRLGQVGGFYVYMNNVRVQPYGTSESDLVGFEERRNKNAGRYYFSHRRMFGGVFLDSEKSQHLKEKAGREGFQVNAAYRGLRFWLREIFLDFADTYYGSKSEAAKTKKKSRKHRSAKAKARLAEQKKVYLEDVKVAGVSLADIPTKIKVVVKNVRTALRDERQGIPGLNLKSCNDSIFELRGILKKIEELPGEPQQAFVIEDGDELVGVEDYLTRRHGEIEKLSKVIVNLTSEYHKLAVKANAQDELKRDIEARIRSADTYVKSAISEAMQPLLGKVVELSGKLREYEECQIAHLVEVRKEAMDGHTPKQIANDSSGILSKTLEKAFEGQRRELKEHSLVVLEQMRDDIEHVADASSSAFIAKEYAEEITRLKEKVSLLVDSAQLGLVLESATHEYEGQLSLIKRTLKKLSQKFQGQELKNIETIEHSFEIVDERLRLFDPLLRRKTTATQTLTGSEIQEFINRRFSGGDLSSDLIIYTPSFIKAEWHRVKRPVFLGAIHNLVLNAVYWSAKSNEAPRIKFSIFEEMLIISDNGSGVPTSDQERVFDAGFSRRPSGRGIGLYVAKESLWGIGYVLTLSEVPALGALTGANFQIQKWEGKA